MTGTGFCLASARRPHPPSAATTTSSAASLIIPIMYLDVVERIVPSRSAQCANLREYIDAGSERIPPSG